MIVHLIRKSLFLFLQLERYQDVVKNTEEFEAKLVSLGEN